MQPPKQNNPPVAYPRPLGGEKLDLIYTEGPLHPNHFDAYEQTQYLGTLTEARHELAYFVEQGWATREPTGDFNHPITSSDMQTYLREHLLYAPPPHEARMLIRTTPDRIHRSTYNGETDRFYTEAHLLNAFNLEPIENADTLEFPTSEDEATWEAQADEELRKNGFTRLTPWMQDGASIPARVARQAS